MFLTGQSYDRHLAVMPTDTASVSAWREWLEPVVSSTWQSWALLGSPGYPIDVESFWRKAELGIGRRLTPAAEDVYLTESAWLFHGDCRGDSRIVEEVAKRMGMVVHNRPPDVRLRRLYTAALCRFLELRGFDALRASGEVEVLREAQEAHTMLLECFEDLDDPRESELAEVVLRDIERLDLPSDTDAWLRDLQSVHESGMALAERFMAAALDDGVDLQVMFDEETDARASVLRCLGGISRQVERTLPRDLRREVAPFELTPDGVGAWSDGASCDLRSLAVERAALFGELSHQHAEMFASALLKAMSVGDITLPGFVRAPATRGGTAVHLWLPPSLAVRLE